MERKRGIMITFRCSGCRYDYSVPAKYAGKKVRCKKCNRMNLIPLSSSDPLQSNNLEPCLQASQKYDNSRTCAHEAHALTISHQDTGGIPKPAIIVIASLVVLLLGFFLYMFVLRNTWEIDNYSNIYDLSHSGSDLILSGAFAEGFSQYEDLFALVGSKELKDADLRHLLETAKEHYEVTKPKWDKIYRPLFLKQKEAEHLVQLLKYKEAIQLSKNILSQHAMYHDDAVIKNSMAKSSKLIEQAEARWQHAINTERTELLSTLVSLKEQANTFGKANKWDEAIVCLQSIIDAQPEIIWTDQVRETIDYARVQIVNARHLPDMVNLFKQASELSQKHKWKDVVDRLEALIALRPATSTSEIDHVVNNAREQLAAARTVLTEERLLAEKRERLEDEIRHLNANTTIIRCWQCNGTGNKPPNEWTSAEMGMFEARAEAFGGNGFVEMRIACSLCKGKGRLKKVFDKFYNL